MTQKNATQMIVSEPRDVSDPSLLPHETPLAMPEQDFGVAPARSSAARSVRVLAPRVALFGASAMLMVAFAFELYNVLSVTGMTPLQAVFLVLSTLAFGWIALGSLSAAMGFLPLFSREPALSVTLPDAEGSLWGRTALLFPVYHEDAARIAGTIEAIAGEQLMARYEEALTELTEAQREAVMLRVEFGFSYPEIASAMNISTANAARMTVCRGLEKLAERL